MPPAAVSPADRRRSDAIDGLRALAALSVLAFHVWLYRVDRPHTDLQGLDAVLFEANVGLVCFFVLSGFLLYRAFARAALTGSAAVSTRGYALRRVARIVPAYYACIAGCLALFALVGFDHITPSPGEVPLFLVFGQNYTPGTLMQLNPVLWTLGVEAAFYVLLPLVGLAALALGPRRRAAQWALLLGILAVSIAWNVAGVQGRWDPVLLKALPAFLGYFAVGMLVALWAQSGPRRIGPALTAALVVAGLALVGLNGAWHETWTARTVVQQAAASLPAAAGFALLIAAATAGVGRGVSWLSWRPLVAVGVVSYGVYLWHLPLLIALREAGLLPHALAPRMLVVLAAALLVAALSWHVLEKPAIAWAHRRHVRRHRGRTAAIPPAPAPAPARG